MDTQPSSGQDLPLLLLIAPGRQLFREYLFRSLSAHYRIHLVNSEHPTWELPYISSSTTVPDMQAGTLTAVAKSVNEEERVAGVLCWDEARILPTAHVAAALGLPGGECDAVERCRDKLLGREALAAAGVPQPRFAVAAGVDDALLAADRIGWPVVVKPRAAAASYGVALVKNAGELVELFDFAKDATVPDAPRHERRVLVEEWLDAPEISIDAVVRHGHVTPVYLARKEVGFAPYFEETGHLLDARDPLLADPGVLDVLRGAHEAIGLRDGWTHTELKLTADGPKLIEVNGRLGGDLIPYLGLLATGTDPGLAAAAVACDREPDLENEHALATAIRFFYTEKEAVIESVAFDAAALDPAVASAVVVAQPGSVVAPPPKGITSGRIAFAIAVADDPESCRRALDGAQAALRVELADGAP